MDLGTIGDATGSRDPLGTADSGTDPGAQVAAVPPIRTDRNAWAQRGESVSHTPVGTATTAATPAQRRLLAAGSVILALGVLTVAALDIVGAGEPGAILHMTISQVGLTPLAPVFEAAVLAVAAGAAVVLAIAVRLRREHRAQAVAGAVLGAVAVVGFVLVAVFTKQDWSRPPELSGVIHRLGSLAAFLALPTAVIVLARRAQAARRVAAGAMVAALAGMASFLPIVIAIASVGMRGGWWRQVPLGLVERAIALGDIAALGLLAALCLGELRRSREPGELREPRELGELREPGELRERRQLRLRR